MWLVSFDKVFREATRPLRKERCLATASAPAKIGLNMFKCARAKLFYALEHVSEYSHLNPLVSRGNELGTRDPKPAFDVYGFPCWEGSG